MPRYACRRDGGQTYPVGDLQKNSSWMLSRSRKVSIALPVYSGLFTPECGMPSRFNFASHSLRSSLRSTKHLRDQDLYGTH